MSIFKGTTARCTVHFAKASFEGDKRKAVEQFIGLKGEGTVRRWFNQGILPAGENLVRFRFYLEFLGYEVVELANLKKPIRDASRLLAFRVVELGALIDALGFGGVKSGKDQVLQILHGQRGTSKNRLQILAAYVKKHEHLLSQKQEGVPKLRFRGKELGEERVPQTSTDRTRKRAANGTGKEVLLQSLAGMVLAMQPLAEMAVSDAFSPKDRQLIRELAGGDGVFRLSTSLNRLCNELARREFGRDKK